MKPRPKSTISVSGDVHVCHRCCGSYFPSVATCCLNAPLNQIQQASQIRHIFIFDPLAITKFLITAISISFAVLEYTPVFVALETRLVLTPFYATLFLHFHFAELCIFCACSTHEALKCIASRETFAHYSAQTNVNRAVYVVHANRKISQQPANGTTVTMQCKCNSPPFMATCDKIAHIL